MTKFRKRALLSSVAMLLVALVALGSATFAWFTQDPTSTVSGLVLKTETSASLVALSQTQAILMGSGADNAAKEADAAGTIANYSHNTYLNAESNGSGGYQSKATPFVLQPASLDFASATADSSPSIAFYKIAAGSSGEYTASATAQSKTASAGLASTEVYAEKIYLAIQGGTSAEEAFLTSIKATKGTSTSMFAGARIAVTDLTNSKILGVWGIDSAGNIYLTAANNTYDNVKSSGAYTLNTLTNATAATYPTSGGTAKSIGSVSTTPGSSYVTLYVWLDGEDNTVYSTAVDASTLLSAIELKFSVASAAA